VNKYSGSDFDEYLEEEDLLDEVSERAQQRLLALQIEDVINAARKAKTDGRDHADPERLNHYLFNHDNTAVALQWLSRLARTLRSILESNSYRVHAESGSGERYAHPGRQG
jgi:hypothetical protein